MELFEFLLPLILFNIVSQIIFKSLYNEKKLTYILNCNNKTFKHIIFIVTNVILATVLINGLKLNNYIAGTIVGIIGGATYSIIYGYGEYSKDKVKNGE